MLFQDYPEGKHNHTVNEIWMGRAKALLLVLGKLCPRCLILVNCMILGLLTDLEGRNDKKCLGLRFRQMHRPLKENQACHRVKGA